jgi:hypothetical protein
VALAQNDAPANQLAQFADIERFIDDGVHDLAERLQRLVLRAGGHHQDNRPFGIVAVKGPDFLQYSRAVEAGHAHVQQQNRISLPRQVLDGVHAILGGVTGQACARESKGDEVPDTVIVLDNQYVF